jgi:hypothetical protein
VPCGEDELAVKSRPDHTCNSVDSLMLLSLNHRSYIFSCVFKERFLFYFTVSLETGCSNDPEGL